MFIERAKGKNATFSVTLEPSTVELVASFFWILLGLIFDHEDEGDVFLRNVRLSQ
jgi:hypothetical protein